MYAGANQRAGGHTNTFRKENSLEPMLLLNPRRNSWHPDSGRDVTGRGTSRSLPESAFVHDRANGARTWHTLRRVANHKWYHAQRASINSYPTPLDFGLLFAAPSFVARHAVAR